jgi:NADH:ubiquinone oxidoreductase subunit 3 (subunit A)
MTAIHLVPPVAFVIVLGAVWLQSRGMDIFAPRRGDGPEAPGKRKPYASGEHVDDHRAQPDYAQFFHFAFFFTLLHVVALVVATVPRGVPAAAALAAAFVVSAGIGLLVLFRR